MTRLAAIFGALVCALAVPYAAAAQSASSTPGQASGTVTALGGSWLTIQTAGRRTGVVNALVASANAVTQGDYPYVWGGGHPEAGVASAVAGAKGHKAKVVGFDCSGSVAAVLAGAGLWPAGGPVPNDAGVITELLQQKLIARGPGQGPVGVTLYDHPGVHIFMNIDGRFFGTSDGGGGASAKGGPGWLDDGAPDASSRAFREYHILASVLKDSTTYGHTITFQAGTETLFEGATVGDKVAVTYGQGASGTLVASALAFAGAVTQSGTVTAIAADGSSFTITAADGTSQTFAPSYAGLLDGLEVGDQLQVTYTANAGTLIARAVTVTAAPAPPPTPTNGAGASPAGSSDGSNAGSGDGSGGGYTGPGYGGGGGGGSGSGSGGGYGGSGGGYYGNGNG